ncbi:MAG: FAD-dependent oxidoreductase [Propionibacteriaceae bacterium]|jgi:2,4-dienoyl-CoA reductase-like NADH-dependent reductase (Old Yellow Enzyme family)|nr:FAD-dependent oxidoreductase [Propionibacteriaceae bacterium]
MAFEHLFRPIKVGSQEFKNRIVMSPHSGNWQRGSAKDLAYLRARAEGGAAALILASTVFSPYDTAPHGANPIGSPAGVERHAKAIATIHEAGAKAICEIAAGGVAQSSASVPLGMFSNQSRSMLKSEYGLFAHVGGLTAQACREAGADGVELMMSFGAAMQLYNSPLYNKREDEYGGTMEKRLRFSLEAIAAMRAVVGPDFIIGAVVDVDESNLDGLTLEEGVEMCRLLTAPGNLDYLRVNANNVKSEEGHLHYPSSYLPQGIALYAAAAVREVVTDIPIIGSHHINTAEFAEQAIAEGQCDIVSMARALIADPELPNKARLGQTEEIRACIGCVEACYQRYMLNEPIACSVNPEAGHEELPPPAPAETPKQVLVVGGGLAGLETALVAAQRGHTVTVWEQEPELGGTVHVQSKLPGLSDRAEIARWLELQLTKAGATIEKSKPATADAVLAFGADTVVLATGADYDNKGITQNLMFPIPGLDQLHVYTPEDIVRRGATVEGDRVVVYDTTGYLVGPGVAELLADQGKEVEFVTQQPYAGMMLTSNYMHNVIMARLLTKARLTRDVQIRGVAGGSVALRNIYTYEESTLEGIDAIVLVTARTPNEELYQQLSGQIKDLKLVGDVDRCNYVNFGMYDAMQAGKRIGALV